MRQTVAFVILLLPMMAEGSQPHGTYQRATIQAHDGVPCFGVPDTRETRAAPPIIAGVTVVEAAAARQLEMSVKALANWVDAVRAGRSLTSEALKKAAAFFAKESK